MHSRSQTRRFIGLALSIAVFLAMAGEGLGYRRTCPHHEKTSAPAVHEGPAAHASHEEPAEDHGQHPCSCLGGCTPAAMGFALPGAANVVALVATTAATTNTPHDDEVAAPRVAFLLPFANAPPSA
jgi:hypothetical protein